jgi:hypothetical protein
MLNDVPFLIGLSCPLMIGRRPCRSSHAGPARPLQFHAMAPISVKFGGDIRFSRSYPKFLKVCVRNNYFVIQQLLKEPTLVEFEQQVNDI